MNKIKTFLFSVRLKHAVNKAKKATQVTGKRYMVLNVGGKPVVVSKQRAKEWIAKRKFVKGVTISDLEKKALFITQ